MIKFFEKSKKYFYDERKLYSFSLKANIYILFDRILSDK